MRLQDLQTNKLYLLSSYCCNAESKIVNLFLKLSKIIAEINHTNKKHSSNIATHTGLLIYKNNDWYIYEVSYEGCIYSKFQKNNKIYYITDLFEVESDVFNVLDKLYFSKDTKIKHKYDKKYNLYAAFFSVKIYSQNKRYIHNTIAAFINFVTRFLYFSKYFICSLFNRGGFKVSKNCTARALSTVQEIFWKCKVRKIHDLSGINKILQNYEGSYYGVYPQEILNNCKYETLEITSHD